jgi:hypothetical protein
MEHVICSASFSSLAAVLCASTRPLSAPLPPLARPVLSSAPLLVGEPLDGVPSDDTALLLLPPPLLLLLLLLLLLGSGSGRGQPASRCALSALILQGASHIGQ